jgi:endonuclease YncB( thermonuclease family)
MVQAKERLMDRMLIGGLAAMGAIAAGFTIQGLLARPPADPVAFECQVTRVHDGDTLTCSSGVRVRLNAINARELDGSCGTGHPCPAASANAARDYLARLALGQILACRQTGTSYNRVTAWCARENGSDLSCAMIRSGMAAPWERFDPEGRLRDCRRR